MPGTEMPGTGAEPPAGPVSVSVVVPVYRNAATLAELHRRLAAVLDGAAPGAWELVFVDDACPEGSLEPLRHVAGKDQRVGVVALARNVGQHRAILAGLARTSGTTVVVLDADLQDPPEAIPQLLARLGPEAAGVFAGRRGRYESTARLVTGRALKRALHHVSGRRLPPDAGLFLAMTRELADQVLADPEPDPHVLASIARSGLPLVSVAVRRDRRPSGRSAYSLPMRLQVATRALRVLAGRPSPFARRPGRRIPPSVPVRELIGRPVSSGAVPSERP